ncbi:hypothetical protein AB5J62_06880 [Amycolatopsis sp. cg5]|uniref:hypothetical protein n=1 Tax=Amycolatopsis sp. cg5 TaxID=3238802 RepID=UPI0035266034
MTTTENPCDALDCQNASVPGHRICMACSDQAGTELVGLPRLYDELERTLTLGRTGMRERISGWRPNGISLNEPAVNIRAEMVEVLSAWAKLVVDELGVAPGYHRQVRKLAGFLMVHFDALMAHPAASDFVEEINDLAGAARGVLEPSNEMQLDLGPCAEQDCDRTVHATIKGDGEWSPDQVGCEAGHTVRPDQWLLLGRRIERAQQNISVSSHAA